MNPTRPSFIAFDGTPLTGRAEPRVQVTDNSVLTKNMQGEISDAYRIFHGQAALSIAPFQVRHWVSPSGLVLRMVRNGIEDTIYVSTEDSKRRGLFELTHSFCIEGSWIDPQLMGAKGPDLGTYPIIKNPIQAVNGVFGTHQLCMMTGPNNDTFQAIQVTGVPGSVWDMQRHQATGSTASVKPVVLSYTPPPGEPALADNYQQWHYPHFSNGNTITDSSGVVLFTAPEVPDGLAEPVSPVTQPALVDSVATRVAMQAVKAGSLNEVITRYVFASRLVKRTGKSTYAVDQNHITFIDVPHYVSPTSSSAGGGELDDDAGQKLLCIYWTFDGVATRGYGTYTVKPDFPFRYWATSDMDNVSQVTFVGCRENTKLTPFATPGHKNSGDGYWSRVTQVAGESVPRADLFFLPKDVGFETATWNHQTSYPVTTYMQAGSESWSVDYDPIGFGPGGWAILANVIDRRDLDVRMNAAPLSELDLVWTKIAMLEGSVNTTANLSYAKDIQARKFQPNHFASSMFEAPCIGGELAPMPVFPEIYSVNGLGNVDEWFLGIGEQFEVSDQWTGTISGGDMRPQIAAIYDDHVVNPSKTVILRDNLLSNSVSYSYKTRFVIDYDHKGQFCASILVEVTCSGATWGAVASEPWRGASEVKSHPTYTATVSIETIYRGTKNVTQLVTGSCSRPCFEASEVKYPNVYYYPSEIAQPPILVRFAPRFTQPAGNFTQFYNACKGHETSDNLVCGDVMQTAPFNNSEFVNTKSFETSSVEYGREKPQQKHRAGMLYHRVFKLSEFGEALWLLGATKMSCPENNVNPGPEDTWEAVPYFYMPEFGNAIANQEFSIEVRDGRIESWTDDLIPKVDKTVWPNAPKQRPADPTKWNLKLTRV